MLLKSSFKGNNISIKMDISKKSPKFIFNCLPLEDMTTLKALLNEESVDFTSLIQDFTQCLEEDDPDIRSKVDLMFLMIPPYSINAVLHYLEVTDAAVKLLCKHKNQYQHPGFSHLEIVRHEGVVATTIDKIKSIVTPDTPTLQKYLDFKPVNYTHAIFETDLSCTNKLIKLIDSFEIDTMFRYEALQKKRFNLAFEIHDSQEDPSDEGFIKAESLMKELYKNARYSEIKLFS